MSKSSVGRLYSVGRSRVVTAMLGVVFAVVSAVSVGAGTASAADGYVYVVVRNSACGIANAVVKSIQVSNNTIGWSKNWDGDGDNVTYPKVRLGVRNNLTLNAQCYVGGRVVGYRALPSENVTPSRTGQTFYVG